MEELTQLVKETIIRRFKNVKNFADEIEIPKTTIFSALSNGLVNSSFSTVTKICNTLDIKFYNGVYPFVNSDNLKNFVLKMSKLDDKGIHAVTSILELEYLRCITQAETVALAIKNAEDPSKPAYPVVNIKDTPSKYDVSELLRVLNDDEDAMNR